MRDLELGRLVRALRRRRAWRQDDAAMRARVHRSTWSNLERGQLEHMAVATVRRCLAALEVRLDLVPRWRGADLDRLLDEEHASMQAAWKVRLERWGWIVRVEVSYSRYGERGRVDLLCWHPQARTLLVVEVKSEIVDAQALLGGMDAKARLAPHLARDLGWPAPSVVVPMLLVAETSSNRRRLSRLSALFAHLATQGRSAISWLRNPLSAPGRGAGGLLVFSDLSPANVGRVRRLGRARVRVPKGATSVATGHGGGRSNDGLG